jgi:hypothetical protein
VPGATDYYIPCVGDHQAGKAHCPTVANGWLDGAGRRLPKMLAALGYTEDQVGHIYLGAFSAGGSIVKRLLEHPADRARIRAVMLADASYSSGGTAAHPEPVEGYVRYALDLLDDPTRYFLATASASPNKGYGSGSQVLDATRREIELRSGRPFREVAPEAIIPEPETAWEPDPTYSNILFLDYGMRGGGHGYHPQIAPTMWKEFLVPWIQQQDQGTPPPPDVPPPVPPGTPPPLPVASYSWWQKILITVGGVGLGWAIARRIRQPRKR